MSRCEALWRAAAQRAAVEAAPDFPWAVGLGQGRPARVLALQRGESRSAGGSFVGQLGGFPSRRCS